MQNGNILTSPLRAGTPRADRSRAICCASKCRGLGCSAPQYFVFFVNRALAFHAEAHFKLLVSVGTRLLCSGTSKLLSFLFKKNLLSLKRIVYAYPFDLKWVLSDPTITGQVMET